MKKYCWLVKSFIIVMVWGLSQTAIAQEWPCLNFDEQISMGSFQTENSAGKIDYTFYKCISGDKMAFRVVDNLTNVFFPLSLINENNTYTGDRAVPTYTYYLSASIPMLSTKKSILMITELQDHLSNEETEYTLTLFVDAGKVTLSN